MNPLFLTDGYKTGHNKMYPEGTKLGLQSRQAMCDIGNYQGYYITERIIVGEKPWWKKLFKLYRDV